MSNLMTTRAVGVWLSASAILGAGAPAVHAENASAHPVAEFAYTDANKPKRFDFDRWMEAGRKAAAAGRIEVARQRFTAAMEQAWGFIPSDYLAFEALGDALVDIKLLPEAAFGFQQALDFLKSLKECDTASIAARIGRKLGRLPDSARAEMNPLVPPPEGWDELQRKLTAVSLEVTLAAFYRDLISAPPEKQGKVLATLLPTKDDVAPLFPEQIEAVWPVIEKRNQDLLGRCAEMVKELQAAGPPVAILVTAIDDKNKEGYEEVLSMMVPGTPLFTALIRREKGETPTAAYTKIDKRWIWIKDLADIPDALKAPR
jgi:hypothetical protein